MSVQTQNLKLSSLVIRNFLSLKQVELKFGIFTSFNAKAKSAQALSELVEAIKFLLECSEITVNKLQNSSRKRKEDPVAISVEAVISYSNGISQTFKKSVQQLEIVYEVGGLVFSRNDYHNELLKSQILLSESNTLIIDSRSIDKVTTLTDQKRTEFIELFGGSGEILKSYRLLSNDLQRARIDFDAAVKQKTALTVERKKLKKDIESADSRNQIVKELESQETQFDLFRIFHNNKLMERVDEEIVNLRTILDRKKAEVFEKVAEDHEPIAEEVKLRDELRAKTITLENLLAAHREPQLEVCKLRLRKRIAENEKKKRIESVRQKEKRFEKLAKEIEEIEASDRLEELHEKFLSLQADFEENNSDELLNLSIVATVCHDERMNFLMEKLENLRVKTAEKVAHEGSLSVLREKRAGISEHIAEHTRKQEHLRDLRISHDKRAEKLERAKVKRSDFCRADQAKIIEELKRKFPEKVLGRLSELWKAADPKNSKLLNSRLGNFASAIVVDTKTTAESCIEFLNIKQLSSISETFLPLAEISHQKSSEAFLPREKLPTDVDCDVIESLVNAESKEIEKAILYCAKQSIVAGSLEDAEKLLRWKGSKKLQVLSLEADAAFETKGFIANAGSLEELTEEKIEEAERVKFEEEKQLRRLSFEVDLEAVENAALKEEIAELDEQIRELEILAEINKTIPSEIAKIQDEIASIENSQGYHEQKKLFGELNAKIKESEAEHFREFCREANVERLEDFLARYKKAGMKSLDDRKNILSSLREEITEEQNLVQEIDDQELQAAEEILKAEEKKLKQHLKIVQETHQKHFELQNEVNQNKTSAEELLREALAVNEKIHDELHQVEMGFKENFEIVTRNFMNHRSLPLKEGSVQDFIIPPEEIAEGFQMARDQLGTITVNTDRLKKNLKENVNISEKTLELTKKLETLRSQIDTAGGRIKNEASEQRLKRTEEGLRAANKLVAAEKSKLDLVDGKFQTVRQNRKQMFEESLREINEGIAEFCKSALNGSIVAMLSPVNDSEPFLGETVFAWQTLDSPDGRVTEISKNYLSSLAFMFGVFKLKRQKFVVFDDATRHISPEIDAFFKQQSSLQIVSLTSRVNEDNANYIIRPSALSSFAFKRIN